MDSIQIAPNPLEDDKTALIVYDNIGIEIPPQVIKTLIEMIDKSISGMEPTQRTILRKLNKGLNSILESMGDLTIPKLNYESVFESSKNLNIYDFSIIISYTINIANKDIIITLSQHLLEVGLLKEDAENKIKDTFSLNKSNLLKRIFTIINPMNIGIISIESDYIDIENVNNLIKKMDGIYNFITHSKIQNVSVDKSSLLFISQKNFFNELEINELPLL